MKESRNMKQNSEIYKVIDAHTHIFPDKIADKAKITVGEFYNLPMYTKGTYDELKKVSGTDDTGRYEIVKQLVCSPAAVPSQTKSINTFIASICDKDNSLIGLGTLHRDNEDYIAELDRIEELGLKGVKFHFDFQQFNIDDEKMFDIYEEIARRNMFVLFHMGDQNVDYSNPLRLRKVIERVSNLKIIAAHLGGYRHFEEAYTLPYSKNVYFDVSSVISFMTDEELRAVINKYGINHILFGSDFPMWNPFEELYKLEKFNLTQEELRAIEYDNFAKFIEEYQTCN